MPKFNVTVYKEWTEYGTILIDADDEDSARDEAAEILSSDESEIEWQCSNMEPGQQGIESCERVDI